MCLEEIKREVKGSRLKVDAWKVFLRGIHGPIPLLHTPKCYHASTHYKRGTVYVADREPLTVNDDDLDKSYMSGFHACTTRKVAEEYVEWLEDLRVGGDLAEHVIKKVTLSGDLTWGSQFGIDCVVGERMVVK